MSFKLAELPYSYDALEPYIDSKTMDIHYNKHHKAYTDKLNAAVEGSELENQSIEEILKNVSKHSSAVRNNGGGYYNHSLFWKVLSKNGGGEPSGELMEKIRSAFGSFEDFKKQFSDKAATRFGSGWAWLCLSNGSLVLCSTPNQDNPLMDVVDECSGKPILGLDVWEHAYYLKYQNRRPDYIEAFFNVVNWEQVAKNYEEAK